MAQPARLPDPQTTAAMDPQPPHPNEDPTPAQSEGSSGPPTAVAPTTEAGPIADPANTNPNPARKYLENSLQALLENPLQAFLITVVVLLSGFVLTQTNDRISETNDRISETNDRVTRLEDKVDTGFARIDERFAQQDEKLDEINLKLTALIAALNATAEVEAALDGRLLDPNAAPTDNPAN